MQKFDIGLTPGYDQYERKRAQLALPSPVRRSIFDIMSSMPAKSRDSPSPMPQTSSTTPPRCCSWASFRRRYGGKSARSDDYIQNSEPTEKTHKASKAPKNSKTKKDTTHPPVEPRDSAPSAYSTLGHRGGRYAAYGSMRTYHPLPNPDDRFGSYGRVGGYEFGVEGWRYERKSIEQRRWEEREREDKRERQERRQERKASSARSEASGASRSRHGGLRGGHSPGLSRSASVGASTSDPRSGEVSRNTSRKEKKDSTKPRPEQEESPSENKRNDGLPERSDSLARNKRKDSTKREQRGGSESGSRDNEQRHDSTRRERHSGARRERHDFGNMDREGEEDRAHRRERRSSRERALGHRERADRAELDREWKRVDSTRSKRRARDVAKDTEAWALSQQSMSSNPGPAHTYPDRMPTPTVPSPVLPSVPSKTFSQIYGAHAADEPNDKWKPDQPVRRRSTRRRNINSVQHLNFFEEPTRPRSEPGRRRLNPST